jgi:hypothetical protein
MMRVTTGQVLHLAGTVALPGISFIGDPDTGIYNSPNTVWINTAGGQSAAFSNVQMTSYHELFLDYGGTGSEAFLSLSGIASHATAQIAMRNSAGADAAPYDTLSFLLPASPSSGASVEGMRVSSSAVRMPLGQIVKYETHAADDVITTNEFWNGYTESTGTAVTLFTAVGNLGRRARIVNEDAGGDDITVTSAGGNILVQTITVAAGAVTLGFNADTAVDLVERGAGIDCVSDNTDWQCNPLGIGIN